MNQKTRLFSNGRAKKKQTYPASEIKLDSKKHNLECPRIRHVPGHPQRPGSHVQLDEQSNPAARWVPTDGCSKGKHWESPTRTTGTYRCPESSDANSKRSNIVSTCTTRTSTSTARTGPRRARQSLRPSLKQNSETCANPRALKLSPSHLSCRRRIWNTNSYNCSRETAPARGTNPQANSTRGTTSSRPCLRT